LFSSLFYGFIISGIFQFVNYFFLFFKNFLGWAFQGASPLLFPTTHLGEAFRFPWNNYSISLWQENAIGLMKFVSFLCFAQKMGFFSHKVCTKFSLDKMADL